MTTVANPFAEIASRSLDSAARATRISMDSAERAVAVQLEYAKGAITQAAHTARAVGQAKDVQELFALRSRIAENAIENLMGYSRSLYEVASEAQSEFGKLAEERMSSLQQAMSQGVELAAQSAPAGSDVAIAAMKSSMAAATAAFDTFTKAAKNVSSYTDAGIRAASTGSKRK
jgi:phasin family protein